MWVTSGRVGAALAHPPTGLLTPCCKVMMISVRQTGAMLSGREGDTGHHPSSFGQVLSVTFQAQQNHLCDTLQLATGTSSAATLFIVL